MMYLDNGATTFPKPESVIKSMERFMKYYGANSGRGGHKLAMIATESVFNARQVVADFFGTDNPENVIFTLNCTMSINIVIKGLLKYGDHVIISSYEHNAVVRPLQTLADKGIISYTVADVIDDDHEKTVDNFRKAIRDNTKLMICTYASNVFGIKLPVEKICAMCHQYDILCCVDAAQVAGIVPIDLSHSSIDFLCIPGHKGLYGPMGTGALIINCKQLPDSLYEGGTGSNSLYYTQPEYLPDKFESGTNNLPGIVGLGEGIRFVRNLGPDKIYNREINLISYLYNGLNKMDKIVLYTKKPEKEYNVPLLSFNRIDTDCEKVADILSEKYNIAVRSGLHCAPLAHKSKNTIKTGTVRIVPSVFTTKNHIDRLLYALSDMK